MAAVIPNNLSFTPLDILTAAEMNKLIENDEYLAAFINGLWNIIYPVGCYFETSDTDFNPNVSFGGTWVEDTAGRVLVAQNAGTVATVGDTGGEETHTLTVSEIPSHNHSLTSKYDDANYNTGIIPANDQMSIPYDSGNITRTQHTNNNGGGEAHNNLQPYIVIKRWHRTA